MNLQIMEFENAILNFCNQSDLPAEVKRLVFLEILGKVEKQANKEIDREMLQRQQEQQEAEEHRTIKIDSNGEEVTENAESIPESDKLGELPERQDADKRDESEPN